MIFHSHIFYVMIAFLHKLYMLEMGPDPIRPEYTFELLY